MKRQHKRAPASCIRCRGPFWPAAQWCEAHCWTCATEGCESPPTASSLWCWGCQAQESERVEWARIERWREGVPETLDQQRDPLEWRGEDLIL